MAEPSATTGFEFYETLRYFLPGVLVVFLLGYVGIPPGVAQLDFAEKLMWGGLIGFLIHPFGMYKWIPGVTRMRRDFRGKVERLLEGSADDYTRYDAMFLIMTPEQRQHFRKYYALVAFKLDTACVLCLFLVYYVAVSLWFIVSARVFMPAPWLRIVLVGTAAYFLRDDGLNDLRRSFNVALLRAVSRKKTGDIERTVRLLKESEPYLVTGGRRMIDPPLSALPSLRSVLDSVKTRIPRRHK